MSKDDKTLAQIMRDAILSQLYDVHVCLPARVEKYDAGSQKADIKPLLKKRYKVEAKDTDLPVITDVPVQWPSAAGGSAYLHLPLAAGDPGMAVFCERSLDAWLQGTGPDCVSGRSPSPSLKRCGVYTRRAAFWLAVGRNIC